MLHCKITFDIYAAVQYKTFIEITQPNINPTRTITMFPAFEEITKFNKDATEKLTASFNQATKGYQAIADEVTDFAKKSFESNTAAFEKLTAAKTFDKVVEVQSEVAKTAYEATVARGTKIGEIYQDLAKEAAKPFEALVAKATAAVAPKAAK